MKIVRYEDLENFLDNLQRYSDGKAQETGKPIAWTAGRIRQMFNTIPVFEIDCDDIDDTIKDSHNQRNIRRIKNRRNPDKPLSKNFP